MKTFFSSLCSEIIGGKLLKQGEEVQAEKELKGKVVGIYFSAHWVSIHMYFFIQCFC